MATTRPKVNANGHRRRQVVARVKAEETHCALCGQWIDQTLHYLDPRAAVVDEDVPRSRGGSQYDRSNCHLMCRECNRWKSTMTLAEARAKWHGMTTQTAPVEASSIW
jgi:5-methylcytosine-specific restriction endonuclease McrA